MTIIAADIGGTRIKLGVVRDGAILAREAIDARSGEGLAPQLPRIARAIDDLLKSAGVAAQDCTALGVAFPSLVNTETGKVLAEYGKYADAPTLDLREWSRRELHLPLVIENDARVALLGEWKAGAGRGIEDVVMVTLGTGLGAAAVMGGRLIRGKHYQAAVLGGHVSVQHDGRPCTCGNHGCAEAEASTSVLPMLAKARPDFADSPLCHVEKIDYANVFKFARAGDPCASALRARTLSVWSAFIGNLVHVFDPERVIIGGGILAGAADFLPQLTELVLARVHTPWGKLQIAPAQLGDDAALIGCEFLIKQETNA